MKKQLIQPERKRVRLGSVPRKRWHLRVVIKGNQEDARYEVGKECPMQREEY